MGVDGVLPEVEEVVLLGLEEDEGMSKEEEFDVDGRLRAMEQRLTQFDAKVSQTSGEGLSDWMLSTGVADTSEGCLSLTLERRGDRPTE